MPELILFIDGSVHAQSHIGYGAYLAVSEPDLGLDVLKMHVNVRRFEQTSSTKLELQTLLWALGDIQPSGFRVIIYTDSQNIAGLPGRRDRLERKDYRSNKNTRLDNYELYQEFYRLTAPLDFELIKVSGHQASKQKSHADRLFTLVDRASRHALRAEMQKISDFNN